MPPLVALFQIHFSTLYKILRFVSNLPFQLTTTIFLKILKDFIEKDIKVNQPIMTKIKLDFIF